MERLNIIGGTSSNSVTIYEYDDIDSPLSEDHEQMEASDGPA